MPSPDKPAQPEIGFILAKLRVAAKANRLPLGTYELPDVKSGKRVIRPELSEMPRHMSEEERKRWKPRPLICLYTETLCDIYERHAAGEYLSDTAHHKECHEDIMTDGEAVLRAVWGQALNFKMRERRRRGQGAGEGVGE